MKHTVGCAAEPFWEKVEIGQNKKTKDALWGILLFPYTKQHNIY